MSWDAYTKSMIDQNVDLCAIHGMDGLPWAQVADFKCSQDEVTKVVGCVCPEQHQGKSVNIMTEGITLGGKKWTYVRDIEDDDGHILLLKGKDADNQKQALVVAASNRAVLIGTTSNQDTQGSHVVKVVSGLRNYLKSQNM